MQSSEETQVTSLCTHVPIPEFNMKTAAIILAAGLSSRMGAFKPLLDVGGISAIEKCITQASKHCHTTYVVTGHRREELSGIIERCGAIEVFNPGYSEGMFTSIREGIISAKNAGLDGVLLWPCDCPLIGADVAKIILQKAEEEKECFHVACCADKKGHPLFIPATLFEQIIAHDGTNGLKPIVQRNDALMRRHDFDTDSVLNDMDTPEGYKQILTALEAEEFDPSVFKGRTLWLVRHGETQQHEAPLFVGRTDVPLSHLGKAQALIVALNLKNEGLNITRIYTSPLKRAFDTAMTLSEELNAGVELVENFSELNLGDWDGLRIDFVKDKFGEEYETRGKELAVYRTPGGENYFDLRRRVWSSLKDILAKDKSEDILIVAHLGVIKMIASLATGSDIKTALSRYNTEKGSYIKINIDPTEA